MTAPHVMTALHVAMVITEQADLSELVGATDVRDVGVLWEAIERDRVRAKKGR